MTDILLINPQPVVLKDNHAANVMFVNPPLGLAYVGAAIREAGYSVKIDDIGPTETRLAELAQFIRNESVWAVGISSFIANHGNGMRTASYLKAEFPDLFVFMGGPQATYIYEEVLASGVIDVVVRFEGEITAPLLLGAHRSGANLADIDGLAYRDEQDQIQCTSRRPSITDLDALPYPAWDLLDVERYQQPGIILTGRGCPYHCIFCSAGATSGGQYRTRSVENVLGEIQFLYDEYGIRHFFFADDTFTADEEHCIAICREIRRRGLDIKWEAEARANTVTDKIAREMVKAGCKHVQIGAESGDDLILKTIGKNVTADTIERAVRIFLRNGITVVCSFILGNHEDTSESIERTIRFAVKLKRLAPNFSTCKFSFLTPLPGTAVYIHRDKLGIRLLSENWDKYTFMDPICETKNFNRRQIQNVFLQAWSSYVRGEYVPNKSCDDVLVGAR